MFWLLSWHFSHMDPSWWIWGQQRQCCCSELWGREINTSRLPVSKGSVQDLSWKSTGLNTCSASEKSFRAVVAFPAVSYPQWHSDFFFFFFIKFGEQFSAVQIHWKHARRIPRPIWYWPTLKVCCVGWCWHLRDSHNCFYSSGKPKGADNTSRPRTGTAWRCCHEKPLNIQYCVSFWNIVLN